MGVKMANVKDISKKNVNMYNHNENNDQKSASKNFIASVSTSTKTVKTAQAQQDLEKPIWVGGKVQLPGQFPVGPANIFQVAVVRGPKRIFIVKDSYPVVELNTTDPKIAVKNARMLVTLGYFENRFGSQKLPIKFVKSAPEYSKVDFSASIPQDGYLFLGKKGKLSQNIRIYTPFIGSDKIIIKAIEKDGSYTAIKLKSSRKDKAAVIVSEINKLQRKENLELYDSPLGGSVANKNKIPLKPKLIAYPPAEKYELKISDKASKFKLSSGVGFNNVVRLYAMEGYYVVPLKKSENGKKIGILLSCKVGESANTLRDELKYRLKDQEIEVLRIKASS
jgi:hypothetical protein